MPHIARVGSRSLKVKAGIGLIYAALILGAVTTVYPFLLMIATGMKSQGDYNDFTPRALVPRYLYSDTALFKKYAEDKYANNPDDISAAYAIQVDKATEVTAPKAADDSLAASWASYENALPANTRKAGFGEHDGAPSLLMLRYNAYLRHEFHDDIDALNRAWTEENVSFDAVTPPLERPTNHEWTPDESKPKLHDWTVFKQGLPGNFLVTTTADPIYRAWLRQDTYPDGLPALNAAWGTQFTDWTQITLPRIAPAKGQQRTDWKLFVGTMYPLRLLGVNPATGLPAWRAFLAKRGRANAATATLPTAVPVSGDTRTDWIAFIKDAAPLDSLSADSPENQWRASIGNPNAIPPEAAIDWSFVRAHGRALRYEYATRNFRDVAGVIFLHGDAVPNTIIFCLLAVLSAVIVNPLCAYALSRYPLPYAYQVLLFVLATMAFPAEVAMIPNFLLLRDLHLLNTMWALVLPGLANGFSIFLLKGFFDSLPKELYEAGILDGATEIGMFRTITVPLSLPIFSVIALSAFTASYGAFSFAMVVCQDPKTWTLMVWLYDLQSTAPQYLMMAALTLAAIPSLIVFMFAQKVIMRGIILPSFK